MAEEYTRLHITPLNPDLLKTIIPASILPNARHISYHTIQTFPEKSYGYVELPVMDAEKIKKKLNGSILKGTKVKIDKARPQKEVVLEEAVAEPDRPKKEKKKKRKRDELSGVEIGERRVKRGWTTPGKDIPKDKGKLIPKSKYTTGPECLFKTVLPPNVASKTKVTEVKSDKKKKKKPGKEAVVHEFTKTTKYATFLRSSSGSNKTKAVAEYVENKGWVDEDGNVVEPAKKSRGAGSVSKAQKEIEDPASQDDSDSETSKEPEQTGVGQCLPAAKSEQRDSSDESSNSEESSNEEEIVPSQLASTTKISDGSSEEESVGNDEDAKVALLAADREHSSSSSSDSDSEDTSSDDESEVEEPQSATTTSRPQSSAGPLLTIKIPESISSTPITSSIHPLEALYKRPKKGDSGSPKPATSAFSFFGEDNEEDEDIAVETQLQVPLTPFTQKDFEYRGIRSAAPTPDTAHPNKRFVWPSRDGEDDDEDHEHEASSPIRKSRPSKDEKSGEQESGFQKWFWENRGDVNRAWKKRKRTVAKEKRQRESRKKQAI
jgi:hypothetical protein